ncbi:MAG: Undecaprenyl-phosphate 4-deoxy-4-formamido-L-arabinose transferase [Anaerolineae bacterium]|nr:Undecaprenyl-phosphate 4-deoxy-4-formamido-L-arabinose transferase [Anaerolineae bacterium]
MLTKEQLEARRLVSFKEDPVRKVKLEKNGTNPAAGLAAKTGVSVVVPAFNEEAAVRAQIEAIGQVLSDYGLPHEIIVVDDGSSDRTAEEALLTGARVLQHPENRGYGAALKTGIRAANYEIIVITDADGTYPSDQIPQLVAKLKTADMVVGARIGQQVHIPLVRQPAKWLLRWLAIYITEQQIPDLNSGLRAFRRDCVKQYFPILSNRFSFTTTVTLAYFADDYRITYHPINYHRRVGQSKIVPRHFMDFAILIIRMAMLFQPLKIFVPLAFLFSALGVAKVIFDIVTLFIRYNTIDWSLLYQPAISASATLLLVLGFQLLLIGMMADGLIRRIGQHNRPVAPSQNGLAPELFANLEVESQVVVSAKS